MKKFNLKFNVGKIKYLVSYHDGIQKHKDGSEFFNIKSFKNKTKLNSFIKSLIELGYKEIN